MTKPVFPSILSNRLLYATAPMLFFLAWICAVHSQAQEDNHSRKAVPAKNSRTEDGRRAFESVCASCHGLDGRGGERGPNIATGAEVQQLSDEKIQLILQTGNPAAGMPAFKSLGKMKITAVVNYLRILQGESTVAYLPGDVQRGKSLFFGKASCGNCHMINGAGGFLGADLSSYGMKVSVGEIRSAITDPHKDLDPRLRAVHVTTRQGQQFKGMARNEDNFSLQLQSVDGTFHLFAKSDIEHLEYQQESLMPANYGSVLTRQELNDLVSYLLRTTRTKKQSQAQGIKSKIR